MTAATATILLLGVLFLIGLCADLLGRRSGIPRVSLLLLFGIAIGPAGMDWFPPVSAPMLQIVSLVTLAFVSFLLGGNFRIAQIREIGIDVMVISLLLAVFTAALVASAVFTVTGSVTLALVLAAIAIATDPIAIRDVLNSTPGSDAFKARINGIVVIDDAWAVMAFSVVLALTTHGDTVSVGAAMGHIVWELGGAVALGTFLAIPMAFLIGRIEPGEPTLVEAVGFVLLCAGFAQYLGVSMLLAAMVMGAVTVNIAHHHRRPFRAIAGIEWPLMVAFFVLTGVAFESTGGKDVAVVTLIYCAARIAGRVVGGITGARSRRRFATEGRWYGLALLPQAGVALGVALVSAQYHPELSNVLLPVVILASVAFEIFGPALTRFAVMRVDRNRCDQ